MSAVTETNGSFFDRRDAKVGLVAFGSVLALLLVMGVVSHEWDADDLSDPRNVHLERTATLEPEKALYLAGDDVGGMRPGQSLDVVTPLFKQAFGSAPYEVGGRVTLGDMRSQRFVNELWDLDYSDDRIVTDRVMISSPSTGNVVLSALHNVDYKGLSGYPDVADVEAALVVKYGPPTSRGNFALSQDIYMTWVRGGEKCEAFDCRYASYSNPSNDDAETLSANGIPLRPIIAATIAVRDGKPSKVAEVSVRMTDYQMLAASAAADDAALKKAQAEFDKLTGPETKF
jgi:hypothetical protein